MQRRSLRLLVVFLAIPLHPGLTGCASKQMAPEFASSTDQPSYAKRQPGQLKAAQEELDVQLSLAKSLSEEFKTYPDQLKDPDWSGVLTVVEDAAVEGQSPHYADSLENNGRVAAFYEEEKAEIQKRVGGAVQYQAKNSGCTADVYSPAVVALDKAMKTRLEERTRDQSDAHVYLKMHEDTLGKANTETLMRMADHVALASYVTHVGLVRTKNRLDGLIADSSSVDRTLTARIDELKAPTPEAKPSKTAEAVKAQELKDLEAAKALLGEQLGAAKTKAETAEQQIGEARKTYDDALSALKASIEERQKSAPASK